MPEKSMIMKFSDKKLLLGMAPVLKPEKKLLVNMQCSDLVTPCRGILTLTKFYKGKE